MTDQKITPATDEEIEAMKLMLDPEDDWRIIALMVRIDELKADVAEAKATKDMHKERQEEAWAEVESLKAENERLRRTNCTCLTARQNGEKG